LPSIKLCNISYLTALQIFRCRPTRVLIHFVSALIEVLYFFAKCFSLFNNLRTSLFNNSVHLCATLCISVQIHATTPCTSLQQLHVTPCISVQLCASLCNSVYLRATLCISVQIPTTTPCISLQQLRVTPCISVYLCVSLCNCMQLFVSLYKSLLQPMQLNKKRG
jgi:hypothetical protein